MANKRDLKQTINYVCGQLLTECMAKSLRDVKADNDAVETLLKSILNMHNDFLSRVSHEEPGMKPKLYYKAIIKDFNTKASEIIDQIGNLN